MSAEEYLMELEKNLKDINKEDRENALEYYRKYFEDIPPEKLDEETKSLGSPRYLANQIMNGSEQQTKHRTLFEKIIFTILAIILILIVATFIISFLAVIWSVFLAFISVAAMGAISIIDGFSIDSGLGVLYIGITFLSAGIAMILVIPFGNLSKMICVKTLNYFKKFFRKLYA